MLINKNIESERRLTLAISGSIDTNSAPQLREAVAVVPADTELLTLDFRDVYVITSAGLRELLVCAQRFPEDRLRLINVNPDIMEVLSITGFDDILNVEAASEELSTYVHMSFKTLLARHVKQSGDKVVLKNEREAYTWADIDKASQIIAGDLAMLGVGKGAHVGICAANSINWVLTFYAVQKLGAIAMLMNPSQSAEEIGKVCAIGDVTTFCYGEIAAMKEDMPFLAAVKGAQGSKIKNCYSIRNSLNLRERFGEYEALEGRFENEVNPDAPSVVIFTSGSTGKPKGVILSSYNLLNAAAVQVKLQRLTDADKNLLIVPLFHILGLVVCFLPCAMTDAVLFVPDDIRTNTLIRVMNSEHCTLLHSVPTMIIALLNNKDFTSDAFSCLRCTYLAGAAATEAQLRMFREKLPGNHFMIAYGLSEMAPVSVTLYDDTDAHILRSVGKQVENISIRILDRATGKECPAGEPGEILVQGFNLMTGYYKVPLQDQAIDEDGWLHTGDMGYLDADGYLTLSGRYKELIIRGGENIMPSEVESAISELDIIESVKVIGVPSDFFGEEVGACVKLKAGATFDEAAVKAELLKRLAKYKVPSHFVVYDEFPMLGSGKIDGVALKADALKRIKEG